MNNALLNEQDYIDTVNSIIVRVTHDYQSARPGVPILTKPEIQAMTDEERGKIQMSLNPHQYLEFLLFSIKGATRKYGAKRKQTLHSRVHQLEAELLELKNLTDKAGQFNVNTGQGYTPAEEQEIAEAHEKANAKRQEKERLEAHINQGAYIRTDEGIRLPK